MSTDEASTEQLVGSESGSSTTKLIKIGALLAVVLGLQVIVVWWLLSRPAVPATEVTEEETIEGQFDEDNFNDGASSVTDAEVVIDSFNCTNTSAIDEGVVHVSFHLSATTSPSNETDFQVAVTQTAERRVKEAVERVARNAPYEDLKDPYLNSIKRQIKDEINKVLRKSYVNEILITEFKIIEQ
ncbi:MAG: flagellar basal body-associated FliL family protein [Planctomycetaceae bacterium]|nr:flagellar basal body-associated FliL family protein [Planctomycetaceae bacterium]